MKTIISKNSTWIASMGSAFYDELIRKINIRYPQTRIEEKKNNVVKIYLNATSIKQVLNDVLEGVHKNEEA